ncbi:hypothetical protein CDD80_6682 [Ophiocordyceps camponoti-rufipedis]|uniref:Uncharacterized protein n=1 Tax=Ophiocordyceps camponoti-rufipedis TaxID=2004952 RepID=A0A2C5ZH92_9HYPO|nr:hypothetical protein CDD80_6682 [Ophiocordyceps camponoti-rufipedis]
MQLQTDRARDQTKIDKPSVESGSTQIPPTLMHSNLTPRLQKLRTQTLASVIRYATRCALSWPGLDASNPNQDAAKHDDCTGALDEKGRY